MNKCLRNLKTLAIQCSHKIARVNLSTVYSLATNPFINYSSYTKLTFSAVWWRC